MKKILVLFCMLIWQQGYAQDAIRMQNLNISNPAWTASWIGHQELLHEEHAVVLFRKKFSLENKPDSFIIHVSADNQYRLFVNGKPACAGPARSDLHHWYYETIDIAPLLQAGDNILAAQVVNFGPKRTFSQFSHMTSLILQGHSQTESMVNTQAGAWKVYHDLSYQPKIVRWMDRKDIASGLYVGNPTDSIMAAQHPWGWQNLDFNDSTWADAFRINDAGTRGTQYAGGIIFSGGKLLVPRPHKLVRESPELFTEVVRAEGMKVSKDFFRKDQPLTIPANSEVSLLIDQQYLTIGYPEMKVSGGKNSTIRVTYAEALYQKDRLTKGNRNELEDKQIIGIQDVFLPDGGKRRLFRPLWFRSFRFVQLDITTQEEALTIENYHNQYSTYPIALKASFTSDDTQLNALMEPGWRTAKVCSQDFLMSDAYYEQMQYVGDSRVHALTNLYLSGDDALVRNALVQFDHSRFPEGLTLACYPNAFFLVIPLYSLVWVDMVYDYMMWKDDRAFISQFAKGIWNVLEWYNERLQPNGLLGPLPWWNDVDWSPGFPNGVPPGIEDGNSALFSLHYAYTLQHAAAVFDYLGKKEEAAMYRARAQKINKAVKQLCFDQRKGLFAETPEMESYSQHTNLLAVLSSAVTGEEAQQLMEKVVQDTSLNQVALFFRFYLFEALKKADMQAQFFHELEPWYEMLEQGLTTFTEVPLSWEMQRSDCHPWSTGPNIHFFRSVCGIISTAPGFKSVLIKPAFGHLKTIQASFPHPSGDIIIELKKEKDKLTGTITMPDTLQGDFVWNDQKITLKPGKQTIAF